MTAFKRNLPTGQRKCPKPLLESFALLFYVGKFVGIVSQDLQEFRRYKRLKRSITGEGLIIVSIILVVVNYNLMISIFETFSFVTENSKYENKRVARGIVLFHGFADNLVVGVGIVLTYFNLLVFLTDRIIGLLKQNSFAEIFDELELIDEDFLQLGITSNNSAIKYRILMAIIISGLMELVLFILTFVLYVDYQNWTAWFWIYTGVPTFLNTLHILWYIGLLQAIRQRFMGINTAFNEEAFKLTLDKEKQKFARQSRKKNKKLKKLNFKNKIKPGKRHCRQLK